MNVVLLTTGRGNRATMIHEARAELGLDVTDELRIVSWNPPPRPLPVSEHFVLGPVPRLFRAPARATETVPYVPRAAGVDHDPDLGDLEAEALGEQLPESMTLASVPTTATLPLTDPARIKAALLWRVNRVKLLKRKARHAVNRVRRHPTFRRVRGLVLPGVSTGFALACLRAKPVHAMVARADVVVALDAGSHRGAWALARRVAGPHVVVGLAAAKRLVAEQTAA